jgi:hypothetical protein
MQIYMNRAQFTKALAEVSEKTGEQITADEGTLSHSGVTVQYGFDGVYLDLTIVSKPFFLTTGYVESQITAWFASQ